MNEILERHHLHFKNLEKLQQPSLELQLVKNIQHFGLSKEVAENVHGQRTWHVRPLGVSKALAYMRQSNTRRKAKAIDDCITATPYVHLYLCYGTDYQIDISSSSSSQVLVTIMQ